MNFFIKATLGGIGQGTLFKMTGWIWKCSNICSNVKGWCGLGLGLRLGLGLFEHLAVVKI